MRTLITAAVMTAVLATTAAAQESPHNRDGFFLGAGLGWGSMGCSVCEGERESGLSGFLKLGGTVNPQFLLGAETNGWTKSENGVTLTQGNLAGMAQFYPRVDSGFFLKGSLGIATLKAEIDGFGSDSETGFGGTMGLGYDFRVGTNVSLSPYGNFVYGSFDGGGTNVVQAGVSINMH